MCFENNPLPTMKAITNKSVLIAAIGVFALVAALLVLNTQPSLGKITDDTNTSENRSVTYNFFASSTSATTFATTTTATSSNITSWFDSDGRLVNGVASIEGAKKVEFEFSRGGATSPNTGSTRFYTQVSNDGTNWFYWSKWVEHASSTSNTFTATAFSTPGITIGAATTTISVGMVLDNNTYKYARCIAVETTDGEHTCKANILY